MSLCSGGIRTCDLPLGEPCSIPEPTRAGRAVADSDKCTSSPRARGPARIGGGQGVPVGRVRAASMKIVLVARIGRHEGGTAVSR